MPPDPFRYDHTRWPTLPFRAEHPPLPSPHRLHDRPKQVAALAWRVFWLTANFSVWFVGRTDVGSAGARRLRELSAQLGRGLTGLRRSDLHPEAVYLLARRALDEVMDLLLDQAAELDVTGALPEYLDLFAVLPTPDAARQWDRQPRPDANLAFAANFVQGHDPTAFERTDLETLAEAGLRLTTAQLQRVSADDTPARAAREGRLYWAPFHRTLAGLEPTDFPRGDKRLALPTVVFVVVPGRGRQPFSPLAIRPRHDRDAWIHAVEPGGLGYERWRAAKLVALSGLQLHHTVIGHFPRTHLPLGAIAVAAHATLSPGTPLSDFLRAHTDGTLGFNETALSAFTAQASNFRILLGCSQRSCHARMKEALHAWIADGFEQDLRRRGVEDAAVLPYYPYRDDGRAWMGVIEPWIRAFVEVTWPSDAAVAADGELQAWRQMLTRPADAGGAGLAMPPLAGRDDLARLLSWVVFSATVYHAAVQVPLNDYDVAATAAPAALYGPPDGAPVEAMLPTLLVAALQLQFFYFGDVITYRFGDYDLPDDAGLSRRRAYAPHLRALSRGIARVGLTIRWRNGRRAFGYRPLLPRWVSRSVDV